MKKIDQSFQPAPYVDIDANGQAQHLDIALVAYGILKSHGHEGESLSPSKQVPSEQASSNQLPPIELGNENKRWERERAVDAILAEFE